MNRLTTMILMMLMVSPLVGATPFDDEATVRIDTQASLTDLDAFYAQHATPGYHSTTLQENAPVQTAASQFPNGANFKMTVIPAKETYKCAFAGTPGKKAGHEGRDYVHNDPKVPHVPVVAAADGVIAYIRTGAPQSSMFKHNTSLREAGSGWGNHVVIYHGNGVYTRYAHMAPGSLKGLMVGQKVKAGQYVGEMGNSGRSETRHLHFELGYKKTPFDPKKPGQSFDLVLNPDKFFATGATHQNSGGTSASQDAFTPDSARPGVFITDENIVRDKPNGTRIACTARGSVLKVLRFDGDWRQVQFSYNGKTVTGWTHKMNVQLGAATPAPTPAPSLGSSNGVFVTTENIVRDKPNGTRIACPPLGSGVTIKEKQGDWFKVEFKYGDKMVTGWTHKMNVK